MMLYESDPKMTARLVAPECLLTLTHPSLVPRGL